MGYDRFLADMPEDTWKLLPHTYATVMSDFLWTPYPYLVMISHVLASVIARGGGRILISLPPRHGKSWLVSQWLPVWFLSMWPDRRVLLATYEANFAATWGRRVRNIVREKGGRVGLYLAEDSTAANSWATTMDGGMTTAGVGGPITGKGCVTGDTVISTNYGDITVKEYFLKYFVKDNIRVLSYDHTCDMLVFNKIIARRELTSHEVFEINTSQGNKLRLTGEHPVYVCEQGYRPARDLLPGDRVLTLEKITSQQVLRDMQSSDVAGVQGADAREMLLRSEKNYLCNKMFVLRKRIRETSLRARKSIKALLRGRLLFQKMQSGASCCKKFATIFLSNMRDGDRKRPAILQPGLQTQSAYWKPKEIKQQNMSNVFGRVHAKIKSFDLLFSNVQKSGAFIKNGRSWQFPLQERYELCETFPRNTSLNPRTRQPFLRAVWNPGMYEDHSTSYKQETQQFINSPYRSQSSQQHGGEPGCTVSALPCDSPSFVNDTIQSITRDCSEEHNVYDIEVEGTNNFFADRVLIHNCHLGIVDDPHKNWQEAKSPTIKKNVHEWFDSTFYTRLEPGGTIVVMHTRWDEDDTIGYLQREKTSDGWFHLRLPAVAEDDGTPDLLGRLPGEALCPQRYDVDALARIKANMTAQMWAALFQQRPAPMEGSIFLRSRWKYYTIPPRCSMVIQSWDTASKKNWDSAYSVCQTWGVSEVGAVLLDQWRDKVEFPQLLREAQVQYLRHRPNAVLIEDRDSGQALIQSLQQIPTLMMPIIPIYPDMDKVIRAQAVSPLQESGRVWLPDSTQAENQWVGELVDTAATFPNSFFKDEIDTMSQALAFIMTMATSGRVMSLERRKTSTLLDGYRRMM